MDHHNDVEAVPPLPREHQASAAAGEQPRPFFTPRRKVLAVVALVLVAATATGVALAVKPRGKALADQASAVQGAEGAVNSAVHSEVPSEFPNDTSDAPGDGIVDFEAPAGETSDANDSAEEPSALSSTDNTPETPGHAIVDDQASSEESVDAHESVEGPSEISTSTPDASDANILDAEPADVDGNQSSEDPAEGATITPESTNIEMFDNDGLDIIIESVFEADFPNDIISDGGYEQRAPELDEEVPLDVLAAEKVPVDREAAPVELVEFRGPVTDFIVTTDHSRFSLSAANRCPNANEGLWKMVLRTDNYPWETSWSMKRKNGEVVASGPPKGRNYARATRYIGQMCFPKGRYVLTLGDRNGDGFCCKYGDGSVTVEVNGETVVQTDDADFDEKKINFRIQPSPSVTAPPTTRAVPSPTPTERPTPPPTTRPPTTRRPTTRRPTQGPTPALNQLEQNVVRITFVMDRYGSETSYRFTRLSDDTDIIVKNKGDLPISDTSVETRTVNAGEYRLTVVDKWKGLEKPGYYTVTVDDEEVMYGSSFSGGSATHLLRVGYEPETTVREREWLAAHNSRRRDYYADAGVPARDLVWSRTLAEAAANWVDEIVPTCKITRQAGLKEGENISARSVGRCAGADCENARNEGPEGILTRWVDNKKGKGYPINQSATQVWWRGTRYVGCDERAVQYGDNPGTKCYVTVCRYARAGNCGMGQYPEWQTATLKDRTPCGPICPQEGCY